jgi:hypothetical protein
MSGVVNSTGAVSGIIGTTVGTPAATTAATLGAGVLPVGITGGSGLDDLNNIRHAVIFALNGDESVVDTETILTDWIKHTAENLGELGTFASPSSGVFTFPRTGFWYVEARLTAWGAHAEGDNTCNLQIMGTDDNSTYNRLAYGRVPNSSDGNYYRGGGSVSVIADITNVTNDKVSVRYSAVATGGNLGGGLSNGCSILFIHLGDT